MKTWERLADLPLAVDSYRVLGLQQTVSGGFVRRTTLIRLQGAGEEGVGEDVIYEAGDQAALQRAGTVLPLAGSWTLASFSDRLDRLDLFPRPPERPANRSYRRWAFESAALDLALRQAGRSLAALLGIQPAPIRFVVSMGLGTPPSTRPLEDWRAIYPEMRFKLDASVAWDDPLVREIAAMQAVDVIDLKGAYDGTPVDQPADAAMYARVLDGLPSAWIEDPRSTPETDFLLAPHRGRVTWDAPIHSVDDIRALPFAPKMLNMKPSRFGSLRGLFTAYDYCAGQRIALYGGGQFELGPGRDQIQYLASLFHPDAPNDVAPGDYNEGEPRPGLPASPLPPAYAHAGFRRDTEAR